MPGKHPLSFYILRLHGNRSILIDKLYDPAEGGPWDLFVDLLEVLSIADEAMRGVGSVFSPRTTFESLDDSEAVADRLNYFYLQANYLLALRGSLSRIPKYRGIVLPKARTPQVGLTLRSFSNNLTFHQTEVDVVWRTFPWFNFDENTVNLMIVPCPFKVEGRSFHALAHPRTSSVLGRDRYFHYVPPAQKALDAEALARAIQRAEKEVRRVHILVFPEMALRPGDLKRVKTCLEKELSPQHIPMIISGVAAPYPKEGPNQKAPAPDDQNPPVSEAQRQTRENLEHGAQAAGFNRVMLSVYYAGKWHDVVQDKHHRWKLDGKQIEQYQLGGVLSGVRNWWESIAIVRRRLSFLSANSWLTICPLICEDLARLEPVSDLVRGVGPTLLIALLLDGPQLKQRWSARYASVFADDPGSSVLTVTSLGMSRRSCIPGDVSEEAKERARKSAQIIGQWKDQEGNWHRIEVDDVDQPVKVLTVGARWKSELAFDGRLDHDSSGVFVYQGMQDDDLCPASDDASPAHIEPPGPQGDPPIADEEHLLERREDGRRKKLMILDMVELTLFTFYTDAVVDAMTSQEVEALWSWFQHAVDWGERSEETPLPTASNDLQREIVDLLVYTIRTRDLVPREVPSPHLILSIERVTRLVLEALATHRPATDSDPLGSWAHLTGLCQDRIIEERESMREDLERIEADGNDQSGEYGRELEKTADEWLDRHRKRRPGSTIERFRPREVGRIRLTAPLAPIWAVHARLTTQRRYGTLSSDGADLLAKIQKIVGDESTHRIHIDWREARRRGERARRAGSTRD
jgi:hypothetical protein